MAVFDFTKHKNTCKIATKDKRGNFMDIKPDNKFKQILLLIIIGIVLFAALLNFSEVLGIMQYALGLCMPLIVGAAMAFIMNVPMHFFEKQIDRLQRRRYNKWLEKAKTAVCMIVTLVAFAVAVYFIGKVIFPNLGAAVRELADAVQQSYPKWIQTLDAHGINTEFIQKYFPEVNTENIMAAIRDGGLKLLTTASAAATSVFSTMTNILFGIFFALYILASKKKLGRQAKQIIYAYLKKSWADEVCDIASLSYKTFSNFLSGQCLEAVILGSMFFIVLFIGGFPYAATIGVMIGSLALIPYIGAFIGLLFGALLIATESIRQMLWFVIIFFVVQQIEGQVIYPRVVGGSVGLPALWTLFAVVVGGNISGIVGMIVFIPLFSVLYVLLRRNVYNRLNKKKISIEI